MNRTGVVALIAAAIVSACANAVPHKAVESRRLGVQPGDFVELNVEMEAGSTANVAFRASAPLAWNTHAHPGGELVVLSQGSAADGTLLIQATRADVHSFMWENKSDSAVELELTVNLEAGSSIHSWYPEE